MASVLLAFGGARGLGLACLENLLHFLVGVVHDVHPRVRHLVDGDIASNNHGWQWTAGTGTDAAPYFRVFNPTGQSEKFDPHGAYLRAWLPEIADLDDDHIHAPWTLGLHAPPSYPGPIVDHAVEREEALARYKKVSGK